MADHIGTIMVCSPSATPLWSLHMKRNMELSPEEIRAIREHLGLTQIEAGELIGGGPRAFTKYEAGTVKPAAAVVNLLRLLESNPAMVAKIKGDKPRPIATDAISPFEVTGDHVARLTERTFPQLLRRLLNSEAQANSLPLDGIHVASGIYAADGGEDGRITWKDGPARTPFLPSRLTQFQLKAGGMSARAAARDVLTARGTVKKMVRSVIDDGGHYVMLCAHAYAQKEIEGRKTRIREALRNCGLVIGDDRIDFRDADQVADWTNHHPSVATWVKEHTQPGTIGPFRSWNHWAGRPEHDQSPWVADERLPNIRAELREQVAEPRKAVRVVGLSGIGKSRLVLEALGPTEEEEAAGVFLSDIVMYATLSEVGSETINRVVQDLVDSGGRAVVVVDNCDPETHQILTGMVLRQASRLSLITIDHEIPSTTLDEGTLKVDEAPSSVIEGIIGHVTVDLQSDDQGRLVRFSQGFPRIATDIGRAWIRHVPIAHATDDFLVDAFVLGRRPQERELLLKSAALLATFGLVRVEPSSDSQLDEIASFGRNLTGDDLYASVVDLVERGIALRRGGFALLQPRPIAMRLAERQWKEWTAAKRDEVLSGHTSADLKALAARQLALLNTTEIAESVVDHACRIGGPLDAARGVSKAEHAEVLSSLAEISPRVVADQIERSLDDFADLLDVRGDSRRHLVEALEKVAFHPHTYSHGARLLLRLAAAENEDWANNATGQFKSLFPISMGNTAAGGNARLAVLDEAADTTDPKQRLVVVDALIAGCRTRDFSRVLGAESQGTRPALEPWHPATNREATDYIKACVARLARLATDHDEAGERARSGLGQALRSLIATGFISTVETVVRQVSTVFGSWPQALKSLNHVLLYDDERTDRDVVERVNALVAELEPTSLEARVRFTITEMPWDYLRDRESDFDTQYQRQTGAVRELTHELLRHPSVLSASLSEVTRGEQRMADALGVAIAELADSPLEWLNPIVEAVVEAPGSERNYDLLSGFLYGLSKAHPQIVDEFKQRAALSAELAPGLPQLCSRLGITSSDVQLAVGALGAGLLSPYPLHRWSYGGVLADVPSAAVAQLFDTMLDHSAEAFWVAVDLMGMYADRAPEKLEGLRPHILKVASNIPQWAHAQGQWPQFMQLADHHFQQIMDWMLSKGRRDPDATATALALGRALCDVKEFRDSPIIKEQVLPKLLSGFPEVVWPLLGQAVVSGDERAVGLQFVLGDPFSFGPEPKPAILSLPEDTLFAWCHAHPDHAPAFVATVLPVLTNHSAAAACSSLHPVITRLIDEFGERQDVQQAIGSNIFTFGWSGSPTTYFALYEKPLLTLLRHPKPGVRRWSKTTIGHIRAAVASARTYDEEAEAQWEV